MKRMVDTKFIKWIKSLFKSIQPGTKDGDVEIGGNLEVDGNITTNGGISATNSTPKNTVFSGMRCTSGIYFAKDYGSYQGPFLGFVSQTGQYDFFIAGNIGTYGPGVPAPTSAFLFNSTQSGIRTLKQLRNVELETNGHLKIGNTELTEDQLKKLIALIPAESAE